MQQRFDNFKAFVESQIPSSPVLFLLKQADLQTFVAMIIKMVAEHQPCNHGPIDGYQSPTRICGHHAANSILEKLHLDPAAFTEEARGKLERYCQYFLEAVVGLA